MAGTPIDRSATNDAHGADSPLKGSPLSRVLRDLYDHRITPEDAQQALSPYQDLGFAKIDDDRAERKGFSEVVFGQGKTADQVVEIMGMLMKRERRVLATRIDPKTAEAVRSRYPTVVHNPSARTLTWRADGEPLVLYDEKVAVVSAGTADGPIADEAAVTAESFGCPVIRTYDVGVAGIKRLFAHLAEIRSAAAVVVVAGMDGALGSVVAGLVRNPVVAVPTSIGYGASFGGMAAMLTMLNACAPGISVVNIDNGFGAGYYASLIASQTESRRSP